jgi:hypothetical protein
MTSDPLGDSEDNLLGGGEESDGMGVGINDVVGSGEGWSWRSCTDEGASGCMSTEREVAGLRHRP